MTITDLYPLSQEALRALDLHYRPAMQRAFESAGLEGRIWGPLLFTQGAEPHALSIARLHQISPYTTAEVLEARLAEAAEKGFLMQAEDGGYRLTETGRGALAGSFGAVYAALADFEPLPADDMRRLSELLRRLVEASLAAPAPPDKAHLLSSRRTDPGADVSLAARIDQYLTDLNAFRDDVHEAVWQAYGVAGPAWEAFTLIWRGEADTPATLSEKLSGRRLTPAAYVEALHSLAARGWVAEQSGTYRVTEQGSALRQKAEEETDRLFYEPWLRLADDEVHELRSQLARLRDSARQLHEGNTS